RARSYPDDFDGIVAGAPAFAWPATAAKGVQESKYNYPNPNDVKPVVTNDNLKLLQNEVIKQCDQLDGSADSIIADPRKCKFDFSKLPMCPDGQPGKECFTKQQLSAIKSVYDPLVVDGKEIYPGFPFGAEGEAGSWDIWFAGSSQDFSHGRTLY